MSSSAEPLAWGSFDLPAPDAARLVRRQLAWVATQTALLTAVAVFTTPSVAMVALATGLGAAAARPTRAWLLPGVVALVLLVGVLAPRLGLPESLAVGLGAGLAVGNGGLLPRVEAALAGMAGAGFAGWAVDQLALAAFPAVVVGAAFLAVGASQALVPGALAFRGRSRIPSPSGIRSALAEPYRAPCMRAWQLDRDLAPAAPDRETRHGIQEVAGWVYRLALTLQILDADVARIDPADVAARRQALADDATDDAFVLDRRASTDRHLARMLEHREALSTERRRTAALQDYALAWLEEARAGMAVARERPGEAPPERLGQVLEKLRAHATDRDARRAAERELRVG